MLKGFVSGEAKDIVRIPMKGRNLFDAATVYGSMYDSATGVLVGDVRILTFIKNKFDSSMVGAPITISIHADDVSGTVTRVYIRCTIGGSNIDSNSIANGKSGTMTVTVTPTSVNDDWRVTFGSGDGDTTFSNIMLNYGSTALPYEPYGYQEGWEVRDNQDRLIWGREDELQTTTGTLPFKGYGLPVKVKSLLGNAVQNETPAPDNIITPEMCGVRTVNICPSAAAETKTNNGITVVCNGSGTYHVSGTATADADIRFNVQVFYIPKSVGSAGRGTFSMFNSATYENAAVKIAFYYQGDKIDDWGMTIHNRTTTNYANMGEKDCDTIGFTVRSGVSVNFTISPEFTNDRVLPTEFEPYGYKIPITCAGQTTPVYLGEVPTVRAISKIVFDGTEDWKFSAYPYIADNFLTYGQNYLRQKINICICTHLQTSANVRSGDPVTPDTCCFNIESEGGTFYYKDTSVSSLASFKSWLQQQYAAGTPVTIWYVLAEPETAIVNEPLCKIGTYADELNDTVATLPEIPTTTGQNTLTVGTTLAPSSLTVKGHIKELE